MSSKNQKDFSKLPDRDLAKILLEIKDALRSVLKNGFQLILFGSWARGSATPDSDVDLMVILPDELETFQIKEKIRNTVYEFSLKTPYLFSLIIVSESLAREKAGFKVFKSVEEEGLVI
jgi:predicted nucleotidyltransferase